MVAASNSTFGKIVGSGWKYTVVPVPRAGAGLLQRAGRLAALERHLPQRAVAPDAGAQLGRERVHHARADAVQASGGLVAALLELAAGVEHGEDHFERALLRRRVLVDRNAAAVVRDGDGAAVLVQRDRDVRGIAVHRLVHGVVEDLPDQMVQAGRPDAADIHAGTLADGLEPFEDGDVFRGVIGRHALAVL